MIDITLEKKWFLEVRKHEFARANLICFPWGGGNASAFFPWRAISSETANIWSLKLPGRESRVADELITNSVELINILIDALPLSCNLPFIFYGHSLGAGLAFQLMAELQKRKKQIPKLLIASGRMPPNCIGKNIVSDMDDDALIDYLKILGGFSEGIPDNKEFINHYLPKIRADYKLNSSIPGHKSAPLAIGINIINGLHDPLIQADELHRWAEYTRYPLHAYILQGAHFFINECFSEFITLVEKLILDVINS